MLALANGFTFLGMEAFLPLDLQSGVGWSVFWASMPLVTASLAWTAGSMIAARIGFTLRTQIGHRRRARRDRRPERGAAARRRR